MATLHLTENRIAGRIADRRAKATVLGAALLACCVPAAFLSLGAALMMAAFVAIVWFATMVSLGDSKDACGAAGEQRTEKILSQLPDEYHVFNQVPLPNPRGRANEADFVVVGPTGLFVIENKDYSGTPVGNGSGNWALKKIGRRGTPYESTTRNPVAQVNKHVQLLRQQIDKAEIKAWITPLVALSRDNNTEMIDSPKVQVVQTSWLPATIRANRQSLSAGDVYKLVGFVEGLRRNFPKGV